MNASEAIDLTCRDTVYAPTQDPLTYVDFTSDGPSEYKTKLDTAGLNSLRDLSALPVGGSRVLFMPQWRLYSLKFSAIQLVVDQSTWNRFLDAFSIPPNVVELIHDNNGGSWEHVSHCSESTPTHDAINGEGESDICAYHLCLRLREYEFMYARYDFHSKRSFILVMGRNLGDEICRVQSQFEGLQSVHLFHIILAVLSAWFLKVEQSRWSLDFSVLAMEQNTGYGQRFHTVQPLPLEELSLVRKDMADVQGYLRHIVRHSVCMGEFFALLSRGLKRFEVLQGEINNTRLETMTLDTIFQYQSQQKAQELQARDLCWRMETQWDVSVALMAKHDSAVNIEMAKDARIDSLLMRRMAAVSIIFLPATFLATFFSMMFFQVDGAGGLRMNSNIWVYFASTSAISLIIMLYFSHGNRSKTYIRALFRQFRELEKLDTPKEEAEATV